MPADNFLFPQALAMLRRPPENMPMEWRYVCVSLRRDLFIQCMVRQALMYGLKMRRKAEVEVLTSVDVGIQGSGQHRGPSCLVDYLCRKITQSILALA